MTKFFACLILVGGVAVLAISPAMAIQFGSWGDVKNVKVTAKDCDGNDVTFSLAGGGYGEIDPCDPNFSTITLYDTIDKSILSIITKGKGVETSVGDIIVNGSLKAIQAKTTDLRGNITINGSLGQLIFDDAIDANTITIGASSNPKARVNITLDQVRDLIIDCNMPIGVLKVTEWLDTDEIADEVNAPCLSSLLVNGDKKRSITGDFEAGIVLDSNFAKGVSLGNTKIAGDLGGQSWDISGNVTNVCVGGTLSNDIAIHGDVGSMQIAMLHGNVEIDGNAKSVKVGEPLMVCAPAGGQIGYLRIGGTAAVKSGRDSMKFTDNELYTSDANMYRLEDLRLYDVLGRSWTYDEFYRVSGAGMSETEWDTVTVSVDDTLSTINDHNCSVVRVSSFYGDDSSMAWYTDDSGTHLVNWIISSDLGDITIEADSPTIAPTFLRLGENNTGTAAFNGIWGFFQYGYNFDGNINGQANVSSKLLGHQEVTVHSGTYLAAKFEETIIMSGTMSIYISGEDLNGYYNGTFNASSVQTSWAVPEVGLVKSDVRMTVKVSIEGEGSESITVTGSDMLVSYTD